MRKIKFINKKMSRTYFCQILPYKKIIIGLRNINELEDNGYKYICFQYKDKILSTIPLYNLVSDNIFYYDKHKQKLLRYENGGIFYRIFKILIYIVLFVLVLILIYVAVIKYRPNKQMSDFE